MPALVGTCWKDTAWTADSWAADTWASAAQQQATLPSFGRPRRRVRRRQQPRVDAVASFRGFRLEYVLAVPNATGTAAISVPGVSLPLGVGDVAASGSASAPARGGHVVRFGVGEVGVDVTYWNAPIEDEVIAAIMALVN